MVIRPTHRLQGRPAWDSGSPTDLWEQSKHVSGVLTRATEQVFLRRPLLTPQPRLPHAETRGHTGHHAQSRRQGQLNDVLPGVSRLPFLQWVSSGTQSEAVSPAHLAVLGGVPGASADLPNRISPSGACSWATSPAPGALGCPAPHRCPELPPRNSTFLPRLALESHTHPP